MTVLITGGVGFIGQYVARELKNLGEDVIALDTLEPQVHADPEADRNRFPGMVIEGDVAELHSWEELPPCRGVIHLAAETGTAQSMYETTRYERVNVTGTQLAAEYCHKHDIPLVFVSSRAVYGEGLIGQAPETSEPGRDYGLNGNLIPSKETQSHLPVSVYGKTKSEGEDISSQTLGNKGALTILRPQNVIGMGQALHNPYTGVLAAFLSRLKAGLNLQVYGDGKQTRDFIHVSDTARAIAWALHSSTPTSRRVFNLGTGIRLTLDQLAYTSIEAAVECGAREVRIEHVPIRRAGDIDHACADMVSAWKAGLPQPHFTPRDAIRDFILNSWESDIADPLVWDAALKELSDRGLAVE